MSDEKMPTKAQAEAMEALSMPSRVIAQDRRGCNFVVHDTGPVPMVCARIHWRTGDSLFGHGWIHNRTLSPAGRRALQRYKESTDER